MTEYNAWAKEIANQNAELARERHDFYNARYANIDATSLRVTAAEALRPARNDNYANHE